MNYHKALFSTALSFLFIYAPVYGMETFDSTLNFFTSLASAAKEQAVTLYYKQEDIKTIQDNFYTISEKITVSLCNLSKTQKEISIEKAKTAGVNEALINQLKQSSDKEVKNFNNHINTLTQYIKKYDTSIKNSNDCKRIQNLNIIKNFITNSPLENINIEELILPITTICQETNIRAEAIDKKEPLGTSNIELFIPSTSSNNSNDTNTNGTNLLNVSNITPITNTPTKTIVNNQTQIEIKSPQEQNVPSAEEIITYINKQQWNNDIKVYCLQLLWLTNKSNVDKRNKFANALEQYRSSPPHMTHVKPNIPTRFKFIIQTKDFKTIFNNIQCTDETFISLENSIYEQIKTIKNEPINELLSQLKRSKNKIKKNEKEKKPTSKKDVKNHRDLLQKLHSISKSKKNKDSIQNNINEINERLKELEKKEKTTSIKQDASSSITPKTSSDQAVEENEEKKIKIDILSNISLNTSATNTHQTTTPIQVNANAVVISHEPNANNSINSSEQATNTQPNTPTTTIENITPIQSNVTNLKETDIKQIGADYRKSSISNNEHKEEIEAIQKKLQTQYLSITFKDIKSATDDTILLMQAIKNDPENESTYKLLNALIKKICDAFYQTFAYNYLDHCVHLANIQTQLQTIEKEKDINQKHIQDLITIITNRLYAVANDAINSFTSGTDNSVCSTYDDIQNNLKVSITDYPYATNIINYIKNELVKHEDKITDNFNKKAEAAGQIKAQMEQAEREEKIAAFNAAAAQAQQKISTFIKQNEYNNPECLKKEELLYSFWTKEHLKEFNDYNNKYMSYDTTWNTQNDAAFKNLQKIVKQIETMEKTIEDNNAQSIKQKDPITYKAIVEAISNTFSLLPPKYSLYSQTNPLYKKIVNNITGLLNLLKNLSTDDLINNQHNLRGVKISLIRFFHKGDSTSLKAFETIINQYLDTIQNTTSTSSLNTTPNQSSATNSNPTDINQDNEAVATYESDTEYEVNPTEYKESPDNKTTTSPIINNAKLESKTKPETRSNTNNQKTTPPSQQPYIKKIPTAPTTPQANQASWTFFSNPLTWMIAWPFKKFFSIFSWILGF